MSDNFFILELDTTAPQVQIYAPTYTSPDIQTEIIIKANEKLMNYHELYIVDSIGEKHIVDFLFDDIDEFLGQIILNNYPIGIATIYARVKDEVGNVSGLASKTINIMDGQKLIIDIEEISKDLKTEELTYQIVMNAQTLKIKMEVIEND